MKIYNDSAKWKTAKKYILVSNMTQWRAEINQPRPLKARWDLEQLSRTEESMILSSTWCNQQPPAGLEWKQREVKEGGNENKAIFHGSHGPTRKYGNLWLVWLSVSPSLRVLCRKHSLCAREVMKSLMLYGTWGIWGIAKQDVSWRKYSLSKQKVQVRYISQWCKSSIMHLP